MWSVESVDAMMVKSEKAEIETARENKKKERREREREKSGVRWQ